ncbi:muconolactone delta-isomerase [Candidatus Nitrososphaera evergladensis SR1]|jgi:muconolactone D-isomerase|uniref:Muconolactone delta-isomerase n=1 Tax=Candidatus Nitrososphaera evergladensis SR1 TaxID=1459636 RepID=A0A075MR57_9ARCH|nr:muconolactone Delta-isomerase family protein [Candidatus Nitrososphaera evergladensis]AIF83580.1 muconolactone delta-isomerase [Candidatus Nitrososphaera evergladensis SR1]
MLFLVIDTVKLEFVGPEVAVAQMKMLQQTFATYQELKEQGKIKFAYAFADSPGGIIVLDVASNDELQQVLFLLPSMPLVQRTVRPLTEIKSVEGIVSELQTIVSSMPNPEKKG